MASDLYSLVLSETQAQAVSSPQCVARANKVLFRLNCMVVCNKQTGEIYCVTEISKKHESLHFADATELAKVKPSDLLVLELPSGPNPKRREAVRLLPPKTRKRVRRAIKRWYANPQPPNYQC